MQIFGTHNFENMQAAMMICGKLGVKDHNFCKAMQSFKGAAMRLQEIHKSKSLTVFRDFAHAPSKVKATVNAIRERYNQEPVTAIVELHTFSSLNRDFIPQYRGALDNADQRLVYYSPHTLEIKKLPPVSSEEICDAFGGEVNVFTSIEELLKAIPKPDAGVHLWMSSGRFGGIDFLELYPNA
jgi:UDP-N-acetylmuramate: L-alanyl-gamma-D-glutamyl-meso-diaminopimelate ligase